MIQPPIRLTTQLTPVSVSRFHPAQADIRPSRPVTVLAPGAPLTFKHQPGTRAPRNP